VIQLVDLLTFRFVALLCVLTSCFVGTSWDLTIDFAALLTYHDVISLVDLLPSVDVPY
jgi:hypothetical protein